MQIRHPTLPINGESPENTFIVVDDMGNELAIGQITYQLLPHRFPNCPLNLFFTLSGMMEARYMLMGALASRARILSETYPSPIARFYTEIAGDDAASQSFFSRNGMDCVDTENLLQLHLPDGPVRPFMGLSLMDAPLGTEEEIRSFCNRMQQYDMPWITPQSLMELRSYPNFRAMGLCYNQSLLVGEMIIAGSGDACELMAIYIHEDYRHRGYAKNMIQVMMSSMRSFGVERWFGKFNSCSAPQKGLARSLQPKSIEIVKIYPSMILRKEETNG